MSDDLKASMFLSSAGMRVQAARLRVISENLANADSTADVSDGDPYRRKVVTFQNTLDRSLGLKRVRVREIVSDPSPFALNYEPGHPAADEAGYVKRPNVNSLIEMVDMREATRTYEANVASLRMAQSLINQALELLR